MMRKVALCSTVVLILSVVGYAMPPQMEFDKASHTMETAKATGAEECAPGTLIAARDLPRRVKSETEYRDGRIFFLRNHEQAKRVTPAAAKIVPRTKEEAIAEKARGKQGVETTLFEPQIAIDGRKVALEHTLTNKGSDNRQIQIGLPIRILVNEQQWTGQYKKVDPGMVQNRVTLLAEAETDKLLSRNVLTTHATSQSVTLPARHVEPCLDPGTKLRLFIYIASHSYPMISDVNDLMHNT